ncbi:MAG: helix-turn-helix transcriptional regulator [Ruminococcaceae bacterium]|nr:helix-turn-helix transcriptional regulator [Oscillospiraceae bacterium]
MSIGTNIYTLRKSRKITQGQLAEKLGVSEQAISKWENDQCAPDVSLFPIIAEFFGVSIDRLFGYHMNSYTEEVKKILKEADDSLDTYKEIAIFTKGLEKFPNSPDLKISLAFSLSMVNRISEDANERKEAVDKAVRLCREVVDTCGDNKYVDDALNMLARIYGETGEYKKAYSAIEKMSGENYFFRIVGTARTLGYEHNDAELQKYAEENLFRCWLAMDLNLEVLTSRLAETGKYEEAAAFNRAHLKLLSVFDDGCRNFYAAHKFFACHQLAHNYRKLGDRDGCLEALKMLFPIIRQFDPIAECSDHRISARNPLYFSHTGDGEACEEYMTGFSCGTMFSAFDTFFGDDGEYLQMKKEYLG